MIFAKFQPKCKNSKFAKCAPFWPQAQNVAVAHCFYLPFWSKSPNLVKIPKFSENDQKVDFSVWTPRT